MLSWLGKTLLFRILPRRLLPILTAIEVVRFLRNARRPRALTGSDSRQPVSGSRARAGRAVPGGLGLPSMRPAKREPRVVGASGPDAPAARGDGLEAAGAREGGATVSR